MKQVFIVTEEMKKEILFMHDCKSSDEKHDFAYNAGMKEVLSILKLPIEGITDEEELK